MKAVILCAGLGTRLRPLTNTVPKVMVPIGGRPLLQHHIEWLVGNGIIDIGINLFYLPDAVVNHFGDGSKFGARIHYSHQTSLMGSARDFKAFNDFVDNDTCLVIYGDNLFSLDLEKFKKFHTTKGGLVSIVCKEWEDPTTKGIVQIGANQQILGFKEKPKAHEVTSNIGNAGIYIVEPKIFDYIAENEGSDFGTDIFPILLNRKEKIFAFPLDEYHIDIGTPETLLEAQRDVKSMYPNRAVFIDRDGVLNKKPAEHDYVKSLEEFIWNDSAQELIKKIKELGFLVVVVSNQRGVALGKMSEGFLKDLGQKIQSDLKEKGSHIVDRIYYCTHNTEDKCPCRKPMPGLFFRAANELRINLQASFMIGDTITDMQAAHRSGCHGILVDENQINIAEILNVIQNTPYEK